MKSILILDDELAVRLSLGSYFEDQLWEVFTAESSEDALELMKDTVPDVAIVDIRLPGMDGSGFVREVCRQNIDMGCIFCTGSPEFTIAEDQRSRSNIAKKLFLKPVADLRNLLNEAEDLLRIIKSNKP